MRRKVRWHQREWRGWRRRDGAGEENQNKSAVGVGWVW